MNKKTSIVFVSILILAGLIGWGIVRSNRRSNILSSSNPTTSPLAQNSAEDSPPTQGDARSPVTILEYGHFKCPLCNRFFRETEPQIREKYIKTGKVKFAWKDFPFEGGDSVRASEAAYCADDQGKFWEYHDALFTYIWDNYYGKGINGEDANVFSDNELQKFANELGLDSERFNGCLVSGKHRQRVKDNFEEGIALGVKSTPTFFINGQKVVGAQPFSVFAQIIESKLL